VARGVIAGDNTYRTYLTCPALYDTPRWTNYAMATGGAEPYPVQTRPIGVPPPTEAPTLEVGIDPTPTSYSVDITDNGDELESSWVTNPPDSAGDVLAYVAEGTGGAVSPCYEVRFSENDDDNHAYLYRNFGVAEATVVHATMDFFSDYDSVSGGSSLRAQKQAQMVVQGTAEGVGVAVNASDFGSNARFTIGRANGWDESISVLTSTPIPGGLDREVAYTFDVTVTTNPDSTRTVVARLLEGATELAELTLTNIWEAGDYCGFMNSSGANFSPYATTGYGNIHIRASGATDYVPTHIATAYLFRYVNDIGEAGPPGPVSKTVLRPDGVSVTVTTPTSLPGGSDPDYSQYGISTKQIFRLVTGTSGTAYRLVTEIPLAQAEFVDDLGDEELPEDVLDSEEWDLPPDDLEGIIALPNSIMAGFRRNQLCLSVAGRPHAWPVRARLPVDTDIVAIDNIDNTIVVGTQAHLYTATGNDTFGYSMSKPGAKQACVAKRSMRYLDGVGVVYASPDGLVACAGSASQVSVASEGVFTKLQWEALNPASIIADAHDQVLYLFCDGPTPDAGYAMDIKPNGSGLTRLAFHATAMHVDPLTDALYLVLDRNDEPTDVLLPLDSTAPTPTGQQVYRFDSPAGDGHMVFRYRGKLHLMPHPIAVTLARIRAAGYDNLLWRLYADGVQVHEAVVTNSRPFRCFPLDSTAETYELEILGTSTVRGQAIAEGMAELLAAPT
jgi:hypothetical protein